MNKNIIITIALMVCCGIAKAQWSSSGEGKCYTINELSNIDSVNVQKTSEGVFQIGENLTIVQGDTLLLEQSIKCINIADSISITIQGVILSENRTDSLLLEGVSTSTSFFNIHFDSATATKLSNLIIENCSKIFVKNTDITFDKCEFRNFSEHCIQIMNCNPTIQNCYFHDNQQSAILSAANAYSSPKILNNRLYNNDLSNGNFPQINLGVGATNDTIYIVGNTIEGLESNMSGGIGIMNIYSSPTKILVKQNIIKNNRYGFSPMGNKISAIILDNQFINNNLETNPNNGGSGISIYGTDTSMYAYIRNNVITGNLWGITAIFHHKIDMGTIDDMGNNFIFNNENSGIKYDLYNNSADDIFAIGNYWGTSDSAEIENAIVHQTDNANYGKVYYTPFLPSTTLKEKTNTTSYIQIYPNPILHNKINLYNTTKEQINITLYSVYGQIYKQLQSNNEHIVIDVNNLPKGIYFIQSTWKHEQVVSKIIIQ